VEAVTRSAGLSAPCYGAAPSRVRRVIVSNVRVECDDEGGRAEVVIARGKEIRDITFHRQLADDVHDTAIPLLYFPSVHDGVT